MDRIFCTERGSSMRNFGTNFLERINFIMRQRQCLNIIYYIIIMLYLIYNYIVNCARLIPEVRFSPLKINDY